MTPTMSDIASIVAIRFQISVQDLRGQSRRRLYAWPRQITILLATETTGNSLSVIGRYLSRHHTTVLFGRRAAAARISKNPKFAAEVESCRSLLIHRPGWKAGVAEAIRKNGVSHIAAASAL